ncbi:hypothetical protein SAMN05444162_0507 [Paenibacillaceae bacterium GAS479]|nr:hypothetical protein SAMN05444162_0507 [Paenibacillaceae bacterium GAS479]
MTSDTILYLSFFLAVGIVLFFILFKLFEKTLSLLAAGRKVHPFPPLILSLIVVMSFVGAWMNNVVID